ncbi:MAG: hypothetical protein NT098_02235 [Candidatus Parcubacteria bacterium]|nr:hypothetical protein [Candidatus Parcubacteria bacterium]
MISMKHPEIKFKIDAKKDVNTFLILVPMQGMMAGEFWTGRF